MTEFNLSRCETFYSHDFNWKKEDDVKEFLEKENELLNQYNLGLLTWNELVDKRNNLL
jgi:hypothetical protein